MENSDKSKEELFSENQELKIEYEYLKKILQNALSDTFVQTELVSSKFLLAETQKIANIGTWILDLTSNSLFWTDEVYRIFGVEPQEFLATYEAFLSFIHPDDVELVNNAYTNSVKNNDETYEIEHRIIKKPNNEVRYVIEKCKHIRDEEGIICSSIGMVQDITSRKKAEMQIRKLSVAVEQSPITIMITDLVAAIEYVNPSVIELTGFSSNELIGKNPKIFRSGKTSKEIYEDMWNTINTGKVWKGEFINRKKTGEEFIESAIIAPIKDNSGNILHFISLKEDITNRKRNEELLQKSEAELKDLNQTKNKFFSIIAHDLKNPFTTLLNLSEHVFENFNKLSDNDVVLSLKNINSAAKHSYKLLENLLTWARSQMDLVNMEIEELDLYELAFNIIYTKKMIAENKKINLINRIEPDTFAYCDRNMIETTLRNLVSNAIKFTPEGGNIEIGAINTKLSVDLKSSDNSNEIQIYVKDSGVGMTKATIEKLFKIDENITNKGTSGESGTGLGLILCKEFVEKHNGKIWVESEVGKGSTFWFSLPILK